jgi:hypothetical protein
VRGIRWCGLERLDHDRLDDFVGDGAHSARPGSISEAVEAVGAKAVAPPCPGCCPGKLVTKSRVPRTKKI